MPNWISDFSHRGSKSFFLLIAALWFMGLWVPAQAHEFWLDLKQGRLDVGQSIIGDLKVGENLKGEPYPYLSKRFKFFRVAVNGDVKNVRGFDGDLPAIQQPTDQAGLHIISQLSTAFRVTYDDFDRFRGYLEDEGLLAFLEKHHQRGLPQTGFAERYVRCVKSLVQVGPIAQNQAGDQAIGMPFELVALNNPYANNTQTLRVQALWQGQPITGHQITLFQSGDPVRQTTYQTDINGQAEIPLNGEADYLLNTVHLQPVDDQPVAWFSHWASLSFKL